MIVLEALDLGARRAQLRDVRLPSRGGAQDVQTVEELARRMGIHDLQLRDLDAEDSGTDAMQHRWVFYDGCIHYEACFPHRPESGGSVAQYAALALATYGALHHEGALMQLRLAVYQLCLNVLQHGQPQSASPMLRLGLRFETGAVRGWIQDECYYFNPLELDDVDWKQRLALRARRGYGVMIVRKLLDDLTHEHTGTGNRISFVKRVTS